MKQQVAGQVNSSVEPQTGKRNGSDKGRPTMGKSLGVRPTTRIARSGDDRPVSTWWADGRTGIGDRHNVVVTEARGEHGTVDVSDLVVHMEGVTVRRGTTELLSGVDWSVELDERWVVLGPNGAGKTTLLRIAAAELHPTSGRVHVLGERIGRTDVFELRPRIGLSSAALAVRVPGDEKVSDVVVSAGYAVLGRWREAYESVDTGRAVDLLTAMGVGHLADRTFGTLSEGERKRALIARALMTDPEMLLLDEPAAGLDLGGREDLVARLSALAMDPDAPATVLVTHHVEEIPPGFTHAMLLRDGRVVAQGLLDDVITSDNLSVTFDQRLSLDRAGGRFFARRA
jgi:iron complex transport system ATP-binding protein